jgi:hypothetical protein
MNLLALKNRPDDSMLNRRLEGRSSPSYSPHTIRRHVPHTGRSEQCPRRQEEKQVKNTGGQPGTPPGSTKHGPVPGFSPDPSSCLPKNTPVPARTRSPRKEHRPLSRRTNGHEMPAPGPGANAREKQDPGRTRVALTRQRGALKESVPLESGVGQLQESDATHLPSPCPRTGARRAGKTAARRRSGFLCRVRVRDRSPRPRRSRCRRSRCSWTSASGVGLGVPSFLSYFQDQVS